MTAHINEKVVALGKLVRVVGEHIQKSLCELDDNGVVRWLALSIMVLGALPVELIVTGIVNVHNTRYIMLLNDRLYNIINLLCRHAARFGVVLCRCLLKPPRILVEITKLHLPNVPELRTIFAEVFSLVYRAILVVHEKQITA